MLEMTNESVKLANIQTTIIGEANAKAGETIRLSGEKYNPMKGWLQVRLHMYLDVLKNSLLASQGNK